MVVFEDCLLPKLLQNWRKKRHSSNRSFYLRSGISIGAILIPAFASGRQPKAFATIIKKYSGRDHHLPLSLYQIQHFQPHYPMKDSKIYLAVPYAQKDAAKALGARWDAAHKKWYIPATMDIGPFAKWHADGLTSELSTTATHKPKAPAPSSRNSASRPAITYPTVKDFVPYNGDEPPWE
jgi:hypothetical protein